MSYPVDPELGWYYVVSVAGEIEGVYYEIGDWIVWNGTTWDRIAGERIVNLNQILTRSHADLQEVLTSQHHVKTVSGEISLAGLLEKVHGSLTSVTADQHHPKVHGDEAHSSAMGYLFYKGGWDASGG